MRILMFIQRSITASIISASFGVSAIATPAHAVVVNFSSWQTFGDVTTPSKGQANLSSDAIQNDDFPAPSGTFNFSGTPAGQAGPLPDLQDFLGIATDALDSGGTAIDGSAIKNKINVQAGDMFSFNYNFLTNETASPNPLNDFAFFLVNNQVFPLADTTAAFNVSTPFNTETGVNSYAYTFSTPGNYNLGLGVVDINDVTVTSALQVSNANIRPVPFEFSPGLTILALGALSTIAQLNSLVRKRKALGSAST